MVRVMLVSRASSRSWATTLKEASAFLLSRLRKVMKIIALRRMPTATMPSKRKMRRTNRCPHSSSAIGRRATEPKPSRTVTYGVLAFKTTQGDEDHRAQKDANGDD